MEPGLMNHEKSQGDSQSMRRSLSLSKHESRPRHSNGSRKNEHDMISPSQDPLYDDMMAEAIELQSPPVEAN